MKPSMLQAETGRCQRAVEAAQQFCSTLLSNTPRKAHAWLTERAIVLGQPIDDAATWPKIKDALRGSGAAAWISGRALGEDAIELIPPDVRRVTIGPVLPKQHVVVIASLNRRRAPGPAVGLGLVVRCEGKRPSIAVVFDPSPLLQFVADEDA